MKKIALALAACTLAMTGCAHAPGAQREPLRDREEARLARMLEGRVAGEPRSCITVFDTSRLQILDRTAVVYDSGDTIWVARPDDPKSLDTRDIVVVRRSGSQLCREDIVRTVDRTSGIVSGVVFLDDFVPYRRR